MSLKHCERALFSLVAPSPPQPPPPPLKHENLIYYFVQRVHFTQLFFGRTHVTFNINSFVFVVFDSSLIEYNE